MYAAAYQEEHPTAEVEAVATPVNRLEGCIFVGHTNTDTDRQGHAVRVEWGGYRGCAGWPEGKVTDPCLSIRYNKHPPTHPPHSVASAVGAAHLFQGTAARSEETVNGGWCRLAVCMLESCMVAGLEEFETDWGLRPPPPPPLRVACTAGEIAFALEYAGYKDWDEGGRGVESMPRFFPTIPGAADPFNKGAVITPPLSLAVCVWL